MKNRSKHYFKLRKLVLSRAFDLYDIDTCPLGSSGGVKRRIELWYETLQPWAKRLFSKTYNSHIDDYYKPDATGMTAADYDQLFLSN